MILKSAKPCPLFRKTIGSSNSFTLIEQKNVGFNEYTFDSAHFVNILKTNMSISKAVQWVYFINWRIIL